MTDKEKLEAYQMHYQMCEKRDAELREEYMQEPWGKLAAEAGFDPVNIGPATRYAFRFCADKIAQLTRPPMSKEN